MQRRSLPEMLLVVFATLGSVPVLTGPVAYAAQQEKAPSKKSKAPDSKEKQASLTGCVDEQDGKYVLLRDQDRSVVANLVADGFPVEGFAKHVGHRVTVRGTSNPDTSHPVFQVRSIETVSDSCAPQQP